jgi:hypothetical protein
VNNGNKMKVMNHCVEPFFLFFRMCVEPSRFMCHICFMPACKWPERNVRQPDHLTGSNNFSGSTCSVLSRGQSTPRGTSEAAAY